MPKFSLRVACLFKGMSLKSIIYPSIYEYLLYAWMKQNEFTINCSTFLKTHTFNYAYIDVLSLQSGGGNSWYI